MGLDKCFPRNFRYSCFALAFGYAFSFTPTLVLALPGIGHFLSQFRTYNIQFRLKPVFRGLHGIFVTGCCRIQGHTQMRSH
ncbi:MAG: hypothetical protein BWY09_01731 [Candidatus Hydrogenedentes bacterium ADurb.Bin179]|nr:MAG: hypothetical protein BWY09_01731 [Candidatus Hydrogenedentes bacterium ADurb.Bin179]